MEYSLTDLFGILIKRFLLILVCTLLGLTTFYLMNSYVKKPIYTASVEMYVNSKESTTSANINELQYAQKVTATYVHFLKTKVFYEQVAEEIDLNYSPDTLRAITSVDIVSNTEIFKISVTTISATDSFEIVEAMQKVAPILIKNIKQDAEISVVDPVTLPTWPTGPNITMNTIIGGVLGLLLSVTASFLWEILDVNVKNQDELTKRYQLPVLGSIPNYFKFNPRRLKVMKRVPFLRKRYMKRSTVRGINQEKRFEVSEAYNELRTNLRFIVSKNDCKRIIISSPIPEDGKSTTSTNIAITIAQTGAKVILLDCDLRKGRIHNFFSLKSKPGISDVLSGLTTDKEVIQSTTYDHLHVITMGTIPPNPSELLGSSKMEELMARLEKIYDYIILDTPPVNVVSDVLGLVKIVDGIILVVREGITSHPNVTNALVKYKLANAKILGFVINGTYHNQGKKSKSQYYYYKE